MYKKSRPTVQDALDYLREGVFSVGPDDYVSWEERNRALQEFEREADALLRAHLPRTRNLVMVILTCHNIVEFMLNKFIELVADAQTDVSRERFSFAQKVSLLHMFGFPPSPSIVPSLDLLNRLRNQVAHTLELDRTQVDLLIRINELEPDDRRDLDDRERAKAVKLITKFICGNVAGAAYAHNTIEFMKKEAFKQRPPARPPSL